MNDFLDNKQEITGVKVIKNNNSTFRKISAQ